VKIQAEIFRVVTPCFVVGYRRFASLEVFTALKIQIAVL